MKKLVFSITAIALIAFLSVAVSAVSVVDPSTPNSDADLIVLPTHYEPYPAESGQYLRLWIKVQNDGTTADTNGLFKLIPSYPFSLDPTDTGEQDVGTIESGQQVVLEYKLRVDALALTGEYNNSVWLRQCVDVECASYLGFPIQISVRRPNPIIDIVSVSSSPEEIIAGKPFTVTIDLNNGGSRVKDVIINLDLSNAPFGPLDSSTEKQLESIDIEQNATVTFDMIATGSAASGVYKVPLTISYYDEVGNTFEKSDTVTLLVGGTPYVYISAEDVGNLRKDSVTDFVINIVNKGLVDLKLMTLTLVPSDDYRILSPNEIYIGSLKSDDYETAKFKIYLNNASDQTVLSFELSYMDTLNNDYTETKQLTYAVLTADEAVRFGLEQAQSPLPYAIILILLAAYAIYRLRKKKR